MPNFPFSELTTNGDWTKSNERYGSSWDAFWKIHVGIYFFTGGPFSCQRLPLRDTNWPLFAFFLLFAFFPNLRVMSGRLTVGRTCTPPSPLRRGSPSKAASCVCLPAAAVRRRSLWVRSYLSSWLASSVRSRNQREHMRMSFVIKAGNRPQNLSWGMHTVTVTASRDTLESLLYLQRSSNWHETRVAAKSHTAHHHSRWLHLGNMTAGLNMWYLSIWRCFFLFFLSTSHLLSSS